MASEQKHESKGSDSVYDAVDNDRETGSCEGSLKNEVELGDGVDGPEGEDYEGQHLAPPTVCSVDHLSRKSLHSAEDRDNHQSCVNDRVRRLILRDKTHEQRRRSIEKITPHR